MQKDITTTTDDPEVGAKNQFHCQGTSLKIGYGIFIAGK